jgi:phosphoglycolate phosphatase-like HAD superfamily hydrolase
MIIVFDVDGTLVDSNSVDYQCFVAAIQQVIGIELRDTHWVGFTEITARAVIEQLLPDTNPEEVRRIGRRVQADNLHRLQAAHAANPAAYQPTPGALHAIARLRQTPGVSVALATGDWHDTISFKLIAAGFDVADISMATSSDHAARADIIRLAVARAGRSLADAVYVGDGPWDLRATQQLGIPFIGVGRKVARLRAAGARHTMDDFSRDELPGLLAQIATERTAGYSSTSNQNGANTSRPPSLT